MALEFFWNLLLSALKNIERSAKVSKTRKQRAFIFLIQPLLEARAKECTKFRCFFGV